MIGSNYIVHFGHSFLLTEHFCVSISVYIAVFSPVPRSSWKLHSPTGYKLLTVGEQWRAIYNIYISARQYCLAPRGRAAVTSRLVRRQPWSPDNVCQATLPGRRGSRAAAVPSWLHPARRYIKTNTHAPPWHETNAPSRPETRLACG